MLRGDKHADPGRLRHVAGHGWSSEYTQVAP